MTFIFDPAVVAQPCRAGCTKHVHADSLPSQGQWGASEDDIPPGWTAQSVFRPGEQLYLCNGCGAEVWEHEVSGHVCAPGRSA